MVSLPTMDLKKLTFSDQLSSPRRKVVSRLGLSILSSFIIFSVVFCNFTFKIPFLNPVFSGLNSFSYSSFSWPFSCGFASFSNITANNGSNNSDIVKNFKKPVSVNDAFETNVLGRNKSSDFVRSDEKNDVLENAHIGNVSENLKNGVEIEKNHVGVSFENVKNESGSDNESDVMGNSTNGPVSHYYNTPIGQKIKGLNDGNVSIYPSNGADGNLENKGRKARRGNKILYDCDIYNGRWVRDDTMPFYSASLCPSIDRDFDCHLNGRPDNEYVKWRWQPYDCEIPRFNVTDFLNRLRGKKLVFVGDSLNRNMWESLVCVLRQGVKDKKRVYEISGRHEFKKKGFYAPIKFSIHCLSPSSPSMDTQSTPKQVVVCGSGVIGVCTIYFLSKKGAAVTLVEKSLIACAASGKAGGFLALDRCDGGPVSSLARTSFNLHRSLAEELNGFELYGYRPVTTLSLSISETTSSPKLNRASDKNVPAWVDGLAKGLKTIGTTETRAQVHPQLFTKALIAKAVEEYGVKVVIGKLETVEMTAEGEAKAVVLDDGTVIEVDAVVLALGPWTAKFSLLGSIFRVYGLMAHSIVLQPNDPGAISPHALFLSYYQVQGGKPIDPEVYPRPTGEVYICGMSAEAEAPDDPEQVMPVPESIQCLKPWQRMCQAT